LLADFSMSTDSWVNNQARVIDIVQDSLLLFGGALSATGDRFALYGFSSLNRQHIRFYQLKSFAERYDAMVRGRIMAAQPGYYTRMGAAIRYATQLLEAEPSQQKLLLILTDGKPNDLDVYEGRYGLEDTRMALQEARKKGMKPFCITIDDKAEDYLPRLFGQQGWVLVKKAEELPKKLPQLYALLTRN
jgi:nitric oxide reductase NorD protein